jgi:hypothetical protein
MNGLRKPSQDAIMNTPILSKLATLSAALMINGLIIAGVNFLFNVHMHQHTAAIALAQANGGSAVADHARVAVLYAERCPDSGVYIDTIRRKACNGLRDAQIR